MQEARARMGDARAVAEMQGQQRVPLEGPPEERQGADNVQRLLNENEAVNAHEPASAGGSRNSRSPSLLLEPPRAAPQFLPPPPAVAPPHLLLNAFSGGQWNNPVRADADMNNQVYYTFTRRCLNPNCAYFLTIHIPTNNPTPAIPRFDVGNDAYIGFGPYPNAPSTLTRCRIQVMQDGRRILQQVLCHCALAYVIELTPAQFPPNEYAINMGGI